MILPVTISIESVEDVFHNQTVERLNFINVYSGYWLDESRHWTTSEEDMRNGKFGPGSWKRVWNRLHPLVPVIFR